MENRITDVTKRLSIIVAVDRNWAIGYKNDLLIKISEDHKRLTAKTKGNVIVYGRKTLESFPGGKPLKDRINIVLTRNNDFQCEGAVVCRSLDELFPILKNYSSEIFVFGGETIYQQLLPYCSTAYITQIDYDFAADAYFPDLDRLKEWNITEQGEWMQSKNGIPFRFVTYRC